MRYVVEMKVEYETAEGVTTWAESKTTNIYSHEVVAFSKEEAEEIAYQRYMEENPEGLNYHDITNIQYVTTEGARL